MLEVPLWQGPLCQLPSVMPSHVSAPETVRHRQKKERGASPMYALQALQALQTTQILMELTSRLQNVPGPRPLPRFEHAIMQGNVLQCSALLSLYALLSL